MTRIAKVAVVLGIVAIMMIAGCGDTTSTARGYIKNGDSLMSQVDQKAPEWARQFNAAFAYLSGQLENGQPPDAAKFEKDARELDALTGEIAKAAAGARAEYEKIKSLSGVPDYVAYADLQIEAAGAVDAIAKKLTAFLDSTVQLLNSGTLNPIEFGGEAEQVGAEIKTLSDQVDQARAKAEELKKEKKL